MYVYVCGGPGPSTCTSRRSRLYACFNQSDYVRVASTVTRGVVSRPSIGLTWEGDLLGRTFGSREGQLLLSSGTITDQSHFNDSWPFRHRREGTVRLSALL